MLTNLRKLFIVHGSLMLSPIFSLQIISFICRIIANYLGWIVVQKYGPHLSEKFRNVDFAFRRAYQGVNKDTDHWVKCFSVVEDNMDMATARVYLQNAFDENGRTLVSTFTFKILCA